MPAREECTRFRVFYPDDVARVPRAVSDVMNALGAWRVWSGDALDVGAYDYRDRREVHYCWPIGHPIEERLNARLEHDDQRIAPDGGRTGDLRAREVASDQTHSPALEARTQRALDEEMIVSLLAKGGQYEVRAQSGRVYDVDVITETCTCPDWQQRKPDGGCKHLRRVDHEIKRGRVPRPDGRLPISDATVYKHIQKLIDTGIVKEVALDDDQRRQGYPWKFYGLTEKGRKFLDEHNLLAAEETLQQIYETISDKPEKMVKYENFPRPDDA